MGADSRHPHLRYLSHQRYLWSSDRSFSLCPLWLFRLFLTRRDAERHATKGRRDHRKSSVCLVVTLASFWVPPWAISALQAPRVDTG